ncbi:hypothetical protein EDEG_00482 [Edhazardia aedis USNM 41457]|uniref:FH2 domain-containing protein n=1 Tax=Edhazardia aedis (strain USNM 41457) TaxID=1003232 RepID=J9D182_EDHAE|nr:hypothetical protein EDEG_00482 [Edhazardia aedis USNM 41457]|eukprot:EJW01339.1 hypothetical protein EDEG_00482 [Edhazardia aedis USNM 41457]
MQRRLDITEISKEILIVGECWQNNTDLPQERNNVSDLFNYLESKFGNNYLVFRFFDESYSELSAGNHILIDLNLKNKLKDDQNQASSCKKIHNKNATEKSVLKRIAGICSQLSLKDGNVKTITKKNSCYTNSKNQQSSDKVDHENDFLATYRKITNKKSFDNTKENEKDKLDVPMSSKTCNKPLAMNKGIKPLETKNKIILDEIKLNIHFPKNIGNDIEYEKNQIPKNSEELNQAKSSIFPREQLWKLPDYNINYVLEVSKSVSGWLFLDKNNVCIFESKGDVRKLIFLISCILRCIKKFNTTKTAYEYVYMKRYNPKNILTKVLHQYIDNFENIYINFIKEVNSKFTKNSIFKNSICRIKQIIFISNNMMKNNNFSLAFMIFCNNENVELAKRRILSDSHYYLIEFESLYIHGDIKLQLFHYDKPLRMLILEINFNSTLLKQGILRFENKDITFYIPDNHKLNEFFKDLMLDIIIIEEPIDSKEEKHTLRSKFLSGDISNKILSKSLNLFSPFRKKTEICENKNAISSQLITKKIEYTFESTDIENLKVLSSHFANNKENYCVQEYINEGFSPVLSRLFAYIGFTKEKAKEIVDKIERRKSETKNNVLNAPKTQIKSSEKIVTKKIVKQAKFKSSSQVNKSEVNNENIILSEKPFLKRDYMNLDVVYYASISTIPNKIAFNKIATESNVKKNVPRGPPPFRRESRTSSSTTTPIISTEKNLPNPNSTNQNNIFINCQGSEKKENLLDDEKKLDENPINPKTENKGDKNTFKCIKKPGSKILIYKSSTKSPSMTTTSSNISASAAFLRKKHPPQKFIQKEPDINPLEVTNLAVKTPLHWKPLNSITNTFFSSLDQINICFDYDKFEDWFCEPISTQIIKKVVAEKTIIQNERRIFLISLCLKTLQKRNINCYELDTILLTHDGFNLALEDLESIYRILPTKDDIVKLNNYIEFNNIDLSNKQSLSGLTDVENILCRYLKSYELMKIILDVHMFERKILDEYLFIEAIIDNTKSAYNKILKTQNLLIILKGILDLGNTINYKYSQNRTRRLTSGFKINSLDMILSYKGKNNDQSLLLYLYLILKKDKPSVFEIFNELRLIHKVKNEDFNALKESINKHIDNYQKSFNNMEKVPDNIEVKVNLEKFLSFAYTKLTSLDKSFREMVHLGEVIRIKFGADEPVEMVISILSDFLFQLEEMHKKETSKIGTKHTL